MPPKARLSQPGSTRRGGYTHRVSPTLLEAFRSDLADAILRSRSLPLGETDRFALGYLEREIFSKYLDTDPLHEGVSAEERKTAAISKWRAAELRNAETNIRLYSSWCEFDLNGRTITSLEIIRHARNTCRRVLGCDCPPVDVLEGTFTSGASTLFGRGPGVVPKKFMDEAHVTDACLPWIALHRANSEGWYSISDDARGKPLAVEIVPGSVLFTVPKTSIIDRCAAKEPGLNMFCQKGIGDFLRHRLRSVLRLDLNDQTHNQRLAQMGSRDGTLATLDLSSASDLISTQIVRELLPLEWFHFLDDCRSKQCLVEGEWVELNMFSSMGNAFTFELETLIFWSLVNACAYYAGVRGAISVYGDDIICPSSVAGLVARVFAWCGFKVNPKKSYWRGPFRESCGKHYYKGIDVTPFYIREPIRDVSRIIHLCNRLREWAVVRPGLWTVFRPLWAKYASMVPRELRGGDDLQSVYQLVSDEAPIGRLLPKTRRVAGVSSAGCYLHWLRAASKRVTGCGVYPRRDGGKVTVLVVEPIVTSEIFLTLRSFLIVPSAAYGTGWQNFKPFGLELGEHPEAMTLD